MTQAAQNDETILAGEVASIENTQGSPLSISLISANGCKLDIELLPAQIVGFSAGTENATLLLHQGDPAGLRVIKPESAS